MRNAIARAIWAAGLAMAAGAWGQEGLVPGLQNMGIYGGTVDRIAAAAVDGTTTRIYASFENPNSAFYADVDHSGGNPFDPANEVSFRVVPGLAAEQNRPIPTHIGVHGGSLRLFANVGLGNGHVLGSYGVASADEVQEISELPTFEPGNENVNRSAWAGAMIVHGDRVAYTLAENLDTNHWFSICLRDIDPATGLMDEDDRTTVVLETKALPSGDEPSMGHNAELAACPVSGKLYALLFPTTANPLRGKLLVSRSAAGSIANAADWTDEFDAEDLPAYAVDILDNAPGNIRWPLRLGVGPDGRVFVAGVSGGTVRVGYSDDGGQSWSAEVDTGIGQGYLGAQMAFLPKDATYYVYLSGGMSTDKGGAGTWAEANVRHAPAADPNAPEMLYCGADQFGLGYSTNALEGDPADIGFAYYNRGIEAVEIYDFDFTADKATGWTASGQGLRWTTNLNAAAGGVAWSEPILPEAAPAFEAVAIDPNDMTGARVVAGGNRNVYRTANGLVEEPVWERLFDGWSESGAAEPMGLLWRIRIKPGDSNVIVAGYSTDPTEATALNGVMATADGGTTWAALEFGGGRFLDVKDLLFAGDDLFVAAAYDAGHAGVSGVWRVDTSGADPAGWTAVHELGGGAGEAFHARSLAIDSETNLYVAGMTTNWIEHAHVEDNPPALYERPAGGTVWQAMEQEGLPRNPSPAQPENAFVTVGVDGNGTEAVLATFGRGLYVLREDGWVRIHQYPFQTMLHVLKWDELTLGSGSGLYAQDTGNLDGNVIYVSGEGSNEAPYDTWEKAAHAIQDALNLARGGDVVVVGDGEYGQGGMEVDGLMTRAVVPDYVELRSLNGAAATTIRGAAGTGTNAPYGEDAVRGAYVGQHARMRGFTVTGGHTAWAPSDEDEDEEEGEGEEGEGEEDDDEAHLSGGGVYVWGGEVLDCVVVSNAAMLGGGVFVDGEGGDVWAENLVQNCDVAGNAAEWGGGGISVMDGGEVWHCRIRGNVAQWGGGAVIEYEGVLGNCLVVGNESLHEEYDGSGVLLLDGGTIESSTIADNYSAATNGCAVRAEVDEEEGGGATTCGEMRNSVVFGNSNANYAPADVAVANLELVEYSCAPELTAGVDGNLDEDPLFVDAAGGDYRLAEDSPCIDAGTNQAWMAGAEDLGGGARIANGAVDMGAYEFQGPELAVSPATREVGAGAGSTTFAVSNEGEGTMEYTAATGDGWLTITNGGAGTNAGTVAVAYGANPLTTARTGTVTVTAAGAAGSPVEATVVQAGAAPALEIDPATTNVAAAGGVGLEIAVEANVEWTAVAGLDSAWLTIAAGTNSGNGTVEYDAASNALAAARTGTIVVAGGGLSRTCTVVQAGATVSGWDAGYQDLGGGWRRLAWFGDYAAMALEGWIWHNKHGFFYVADTSTPEDVWLYAMDMGWLYTGDTLYPFLYRANDGAWIWYNGSTNPRWFMNFTTSQWESRP